MTAEGKGYRASCDCKGASREGLMGQRISAERSIGFSGSALSGENPRWKRAGPTGQLVRDFRFTAKDDEIHEQVLESGA